jgi:hypothetical protein
MAEAPDHFQENETNTFPAVELTGFGNLAALVSSCEGISRSFFNVLSIITAKEKIQ